MVSCRKCGANFEVEDAKWCPKCGTSDPLSDAAGAQNSGAGRSSSTSNTKWLWWIGIPVALVLVVMLLAGKDQAKYPRKSHDRAVYETCIDSLKTDDRARRGNGVFIAGVCEKMRDDYIKKYGTTP